MLNQARNINFGLIIDSCSIINAYLEYENKYKNLSFCMNSNHLFVVKPVQIDFKLANSIIYPISVLDDSIYNYIGA